MLVIAESIFSIMAKLEMEKDVICKLEKIPSKIAKNYICKWKIGKFMLFGERQAMFDSELKKARIQNC